MMSDLPKVLVINVGPGCNDDLDKQDYPEKCIVNIENNDAQLKNDMVSQHDDANLFWIVHANQKFLPDCLSKLVAAIVNNNHIGLAYSDSFVMTNGCAVYIPKKIYSATEFAQQPDDLNDTFLVARAIVKSAGGFTPDSREFLLKASQYAMFAHLPESLYFTEVVNEECSKQ